MKRPSPAPTLPIISKLMIKTPPNPYLRGLIPILGLSAVSLLAAIGLAVFTLPVAWIAWAFFGMFGLTWLIGWLLGERQRRRAINFLASQRPLVRWVYSSAEWQQIKDQARQETAGDWKIQWGCMTFLLALAGALTGGMLGLEEGILQIGLDALLGFGVGALFGGLIGGVVAGGNYWAAQMVYRDPEPGQVALGPDEIYVNGDYFKGDGINGYLQGAKIQRGNPATLEFQLVFPPRIRRDPEETWTLLLPASQIEAVQEILSKLIPHQEGQGL